MGLNTQTTKLGSNNVSLDESKSAHTEAVVNFLDHSRQGGTEGSRGGSCSKKKKRMRVTFSVYLIICLENLCSKLLLKMRIRTGKKILALSLSVCARLACTGSTGSFCMSPWQCQVSQWCPHLNSFQLVCFNSLCQWGKNYFYWLLLVNKMLWGFFPFHWHSWDGTQKFGEFFA